MKSKNKQNDVDIEINLYNTLVTVQNTVSAMFRFQVYLIIELLMVIYTTCKKIHLLICVLDLKNQFKPMNFISK